MPVMSSAEWAISRYLIVLSTTDLMAWGKGPNTVGRATMISSPMPMRTWALWPRAS